MLSTAQPTCFLIADISGYTGYLADVELDHAQDILADLVGAVVTALRPTSGWPSSRAMRRSCRWSAETVDGSMLLDTIERCYFGFRRRRRDVRQATSCECNACVRIPDLDLKFVVHHGEAIHQKVAGRQELLGRTSSSSTGCSRTTSSRRSASRPTRCSARPASMPSDLDPAALGMRPHTETYDRIGEVPGWVHDLERRWQEEEARGRVFVTPTTRSSIVSVPTTVPPQVAWEFLTRPGQRMSWQPWVTEVDVEGATGGRRGPGSANHCMHGKDAVVEEILDWRPYDYVTDRTVLETPTGPMKLLHTVEFEPTTAGTTIHFRYAAPRTKREKELMRSSVRHTARARIGAPEPGRAARRGTCCERAGRARSQTSPRLERTAPWPGSSRS